MLRRFKDISTECLRVKVMSDILFKDRKIRRVKRESVSTQRQTLKRKTDKKRGVKNGNIQKCTNDILDR